MKAIVFAAGKGTRLKPLTDTTPKALVRVGGITLLEHTIRNLIKAGVNHVIINVHYLADKIEDFIKENDFGIQISLSDERNLLLDTGGGLVKARKYFEDNEDFLVHNVDILSDINLSRMIEIHKKNKTIATLAVKQRKTSRYFLFDDKMSLRGWRNISTGEEIINHTDATSLMPYAFSGIHVINSKIFNLITEQGTFSLTPVYLRIAKNHKIAGYKHDDSHWFDIGKLETLDAAEKFYQSLKI